jgi:P27 family predicted phage terminase small subunit
MVGRPPRPAGLKLIEGRGNGTDSGGRRVKDVPAFTRAAPEAPSWLPDDARAEWNHVVPELDRLGLLKGIDRAALTSYCMVWARFVEASEIVTREGMVVRESLPNGNVKLYRHPAVLTAEAASKELRAWAQEFGLTPSAEQRLAGTKGDDGDQGNPFAAPAAAG